MCTSIVEIATASGMAKSDKDDWFPLTHSVVAYDHARHAWLEDVITIDFVAAVELTLEAAKALNEALVRAIAAAELEESQRADGLARPHPGAAESFAPRIAA